MFSFLNLHKFRSFGAALLVSAATAVGPACGQTASGQATAGFETFIVPNPHPRGAAPANPPPPVVSPDFTDSPASAGLSRLFTQIDLTLLPRQTDLGVTMNGQAGSQVFQSQINPLRWLQGGGFGSGFLETSGGQNGLRAGQSSSDLLGNVQGLHLFSGSGSGALGMGLYQRIGEVKPDWMPSVDREWKSGAGTLGLVLAADASWRAVQETKQAAKKQGWELASFAGHDTRMSRAEGGFSGEAHSGGFSVSERLSAWSGSQPGRQWSVGATHVLGTGYVGLTYSRQNFSSRQNLSGAELGQVSAILFLPLKRSFFSLQWQQGNTDTLFADVSGVAQWSRQRSERLSVSYTGLPKRGLTWWTSGSVSRQTGSISPPELTVGGQLRLDSRWDLEAEVSPSFGGSRPRLHLSLGLRLTPRQTVRLLCGPSVFSGSAQQMHPVFGLQLVQNFETRWGKEGEIEGQILAEGHPSGQRLVCLLDGKRRAQADADGRFHLGHVAAGAHTLGFSSADLPADLSADTPALALDVKEGRTSRAVLSVHPVGVVRGRILVGADTLGRTDDTAAIGVSITAGGTVSTTADGASTFILGNLLPGIRRVRLVAGTLPPDFRIVGPAYYDIKIVPGQPQAPLVFVIAPIPKLIQFESASATPQVSQASR